MIHAIMQQLAAERAARTAANIERERVRRRRAHLHEEFEKIHRKHMNSGFRGDGSAGRT